MHVPKKLSGLIMTAVLSMMIGCDKNENARLAQMADEHLQRQAEQTSETVQAIDWKAQKRLCGR